MSSRFKTPYLKSIFPLFPFPKMKNKAYYIVVFLMAWAIHPTAVSAQTMIIYGEPATVHGGGDITCADNDRVCLKSKGTEIQATNATIAQPSAISATSSADNGSHSVTITAYTANGPVTFEAEEKYRTSHDFRGKRTYHFKKTSSTHRVIQLD